MIETTGTGTPQKAPSYTGVQQSPAATPLRQRDTGGVNPLTTVGSPWQEPAPSLKAGYLMPSKAYIVEDNALIRDNLVETLTELAGIQTIGYAATEADACVWLAEHPQDWQLLIVDLFLLQGSGLGVLKNCGRHAGRQRVIVLSNYATADIRTRCLALGADAVFDKSTELDIFLDYCAQVH